jgi:hypothetical protein
VAILCIAVILSIATAPAQQTPPAPSQNRFGVPGCHVTFLLGNTALTVDVAWLQLAFMEDFAASSDLRHVCPSQPVQIDTVSLSRTVLDVLNIGGTLGRRGFPVWLLDIRASHISNSELQTFPAPADHIQGPPVETLIEMHKVNGRGREYDIRYRSPDERMAGIIRILCVDDNVNRVCVEPNGRFAGLTVYYSVSQDQFPAPDEVSTDPSTESGAILQFDQRLRAWLIDLEHPR